MVSKQIQGLLGSDLLESFAVVRVEKLFHGDSARSSQPDEYSADRLRFSAARWPCDASDRKGKVCARLLARARGHFARNRLADCAVFGQGFRGDTQKFLFGFIAVGDEPSRK